MEYNGDLLLKMNEKKVLSIIYKVETNFYILVWMNFYSQLRYFYHCYNKLYIKFNFVYFEIYYFVKYFYFIVSL
jgi:hypothetical protein